MAAAATTATARLAETRVFDPPLLPSSLSVPALAPTPVATGMVKTPVKVGPTTPPKAVVPLAVPVVVTGLLKSLSS